MRIRKIFEKTCICGCGEIIRTTHKEVVYKKGHQKSWLGKKRPEMMGDKNHKWMGDFVGYRALHGWVSRQLGKAKRCKVCNTTNNVEWANISHDYKRDISDWVELCAKHHDEYDHKTMWGAIKRRFHAANC